MQGGGVKSSYGSKNHGRGGGSVDDAPPKTIRRGFTKGGAQDPLGAGLTNHRIPWVGARGMPRAGLDPEYGEILGGGASDAIGGT